MKRTYFSFFALLLVAFMLFAGLSFFKDGIEESFGINTATFASDLLSTPDDELELADVVSTDSVSGKAIATVERAPLDTTKKNILFIGDSMLERLSPRIAAYAEENEHQMNTVIWYGSSTEVWATSGRVKECIRKYRPDYIIISLGGNELFVNDIIARRTKYVKQIVAEFADIPYVWIGPAQLEERHWYQQDDSKRGAQRQFLPQLYPRSALRASQRRCAPHTGIGGEVGRPHLQVDSG